MKPETKAELSKLPQWARDSFEERAAIKEFVGNLPREEAERQALDEIKKDLKLTKILKGEK